MDCRRRALLVATSALLAMLLSAAALPIINQSRLPMIQLAVRGWPSRLRSPVDDTAPSPGGWRRLNSLQRREVVTSLTVVVSGQPRRRELTSPDSAGLHRSGSQVFRSSDGVYRAGSGFYRDGGRQRADASRWSPRADQLYPADILALPDSSPVYQVSAQPRGRTANTGYPVVPDDIRLYFAAVRGSALDGTLAPSASAFPASASGWLSAGALRSSSLPTTSLITASDVYGDAWVPLVPNTAGGLTPAAQVVPSQTEEDGADDQEVQSRALSESDDARAGDRPGADGTALLPPAVRVFSRPIFVRLRREGDDTGEVQSRRGVLTHQERGAFRGGFPEPLLN